MASTEDRDRSLDPSSASNDEAEPIFGTIPVLITHLDTYPIRRITVKVKKTKEAEGGKKQLKFRFKLNPPCSTMDETMHQSVKPRRSSFSGTEEDFINALTWTQTMLERGIPNDTSIDLGKMRSRLSLVGSAFEKARAKGRTIRLSSKPAV